MMLLFAAAIDHRRVRTAEKRCDFDGVDPSCHARCSAADDAAAAAAAAAGAD